MGIPSLYVGSPWTRASRPVLHVRWRRTDVGQDRPRSPLDREVADRDNTDHITALIDNWNTANSFLTHEPHRLFDAGGGVYRREVSAADLAHRDGLRGRSLREPTNDDVAIRQDAEEPVFLQHDHVANIVPPHELGSIQDRRAARYGGGVRGHDVSDTLVHSLPPSFTG